MNSFTLEKDRLQGKKSVTQPKIDFVKDRINMWADLPDNERADVLSYIRMILGELKTAVQKSWWMDSFFNAVCEYREFEHFVSRDKTIEEALATIVTDSSGAAVDYKWEIARDRARVNFLFDQIMKVPRASGRLSRFLAIVSVDSGEASLKTLAKYEWDTLMHNEHVVFASFVKAFTTSFDMGRASRAGEIAADYIASHPFLGKAMRDKAYTLFHQALLLDSNLTHLVRKTVVKKVVRAFWVWYWKTRLFRSFETIDDKLILLLTEHGE